MPETATGAGRARPSPPALAREMDTFPKLALDNARRLPAKIAIREKGYGIWQAYSWSRYAEETRDIALGLAAIGFARGDKTAVVGDNRPELYWAMLATQALGGIPVPLYQDSIEREMQYIVDHAEARFAVVEDQEQVDKLLHVKAECPHLQHVIYKDARGMRRYTDPCLLSLEALQELGRKFGREHPRYFDEEVAKGRGDDVAVICYTSGTTGRPKGTMLTHRNLIETAKSAVAREGLSASDEVVAYLPMAWIGDHMFSFGQSIATGFTTNCPESAATVLHDLKEIGPTYFFAPPRIWETILTQVMVRIDDASCAQAPHGPLLPRRRPAGGAAPPRARAGAPRRSRAVPDRPRARLRPPARQPGHAADPRGLYRGRGDRPGALRVLPLARHQREAALRHDGVERAGVHPAGRRREARHGGNAAAGRRAADQRLRRGHVPEPGCLRRLLQEPRGHAGDAGGRLDPLGRRGSHRQGRPPQDHRPGQGRRPAHRRHALRAQVPREQAQVLAPTSRRPCASGRAGRSSPRS